MTKANKTINQFCLVQYRSSNPIKPPVINALQNKDSKTKNTTSGWVIK